MIPTFHGLVFLVLAAVLTEFSLSQRLPDMCLHLVFQHLGWWKVCCVLLEGQPI